MITNDFDISMRNESKTENIQSGCWNNMDVDPATVLLVGFVKRIYDF